jgi:hypothetical protein
MRTAGLALLTILAATAAPLPAQQAGNQPTYTLEMLAARAADA